LGEGSFTDNNPDRYWGESSPYDELNAETLQYLTLNNAIADFVNIAKTIDLPFDTNHSSNADKAPWVLSGGSYSGAIAAWTESTSPGTFWAYHASSAPVEAIYDYVSRHIFFGKPSTNVRTVAILCSNPARHARQLLQRRYPCDRLYRQYLDAWHALPDLLVESYVWNGSCRTQ